MGRLPETLTLLVLLLVVTILAGQMAAAVRSVDGYALDSPFQQHFSLEFRRELAANPPALLRDLRIAGPARLAFLGLAVALAIVAVRTLVRRRSSGPEAARGSGLLALLVAVAAAAPVWGSQPTSDILGGSFWGGTWYQRLAPALALLRVGLAVAIAAHLTALVLGFVSARREAR